MSAYVAVAPQAAAPYHYVHPQQPQFQPPPQYPQHPSQHHQHQFAAATAQAQPQQQQTFQQQQQHLQQPQLQPQAQYFLQQQPPQQQQQAFDPSQVSLSLLPPAPQAIPPPSAVANINAGAHHAMISCNGVSQPANNVQNVVQQNVQLQQQQATADVGQLQTPQQAANSDDPYAGRLKITHFEKLARIGEGTYGVVYKARNRKNMGVVALKKIRLESPEEGTPSTAVREISILKQLQHPNVVQLLGVIHTETSLTLVFEYLDQDLKNYLDVCGERGIDDYTIASFMLQMLRGIAYCHQQHVLHRDLKPQNILINLAGELKIADFGLARGFGIPVEKFTHEVVTLWYRPPDVLMGSTFYTTSVDMWGLGCIFAEMWSGRPLFCGQDNDSQLVKICQITGPPNHKDWPEITRLPKYDNRFQSPPNFDQVEFCQRNLRKLLPRADNQAMDLLLRLLSLNPDTRLDAEGASQHPYFKVLHEQERLHYAGQQQQAQAAQEQLARRM